MCGAVLALAASAAAAQDAPIKYYGPNDPIPPGTVLPVPVYPDQRGLPPIWMRRVQAAFPAAATEAGVTSGVATLSCLVTDAGALTECRIDSERPTGLGFGEAALSATGTAELRPRRVDNRPVAERLVFPVRFDSSYTAPEWLHRPQPEFPEAADKAGIYEGVATVQCTSLATGTLSECEVLGETPAGYGFGEALAAAAREATVVPRTDGGEPTAGLIRFSARFRIEPEAPAAQGASAP